MRRGSPWALAWIERKMVNRNNSLASLLWWLILCVELTGLVDACRASKTIYLGVSVKVLLEEISIWFSRLSKEIRSFKCGQALSNPLRAPREQKGKGRANSLSSWAELPISYPWTSDLLDLGLCSCGTHTNTSPGVQAFRVGLNYTTSFLGSPVCRQQIVGLFGLHSCASQFL